MAALVLGVLLWRQNQRLDELQQQAATAQKHTQETERRLAAAEKSRTDLEAEVKSLRSQPAASRASSTRAQNPMAAANAMFDNPNFQRVMATSMKGTLDQRYAALFRQLKLSPADLDKFKDLLVEKQMSSFDAVRLAQSGDPAAKPGDIAGVVNKVQGEMDDSIRSLLGEQGFQRFQEFNQNTASYSLLDQVERRLSYTNAPLQESQSESLLQILKATTQPPAIERGPGGSAMASFAQGFAGSNPMLAAMTQRPITDDTIESAKNVLSAPQIEVLRQLQAEQQNQANTMQNLRGAFGPGGATGSTILTLPSATPPASPPPR